MELISDERAIHLPSEVLLRIVNGFNQHHSLNTIHVQPYGRGSARNSESIIVRKINGRTTTSK